MRIFSAVRHSLDPEFYYGGLWSGNFYPALRQLGHEVVESQVDLFPGSRFMDVRKEFTPEQTEVRARITQRLIDELTQAHKEKPVELFLSYFYNSHFDPSGFDQIKQLGIPTVNFYCNSIYQFSLVSEIASKVDFSWHAERDARSLYLKVNANPVWVQMGADPNVYHPTPEVARQPRACFVGQRYCDRDRWLAQLARHEVPFDIYGSGWNPEENYIQSNGDADGHHRPQAGSSRAKWAVMRETLEKNGWLSGVLRTLRQGAYARETRKLGSMLQPYAKGKAADVAEVLGRYEVVLNFSNVWGDGRPGSQLIPHIRLRDFEAPMSRTCYLTGYTDEIAEFYELGKEIDTYQSSQELVDKTNYYLKNPSAAESLRSAGYLRATKDHTWKRRFEDLFLKVGFGRNGRDNG
jgi:spore maturation protein CgeB